MIYLNEDPITPTIFPDRTSQVWKLNNIQPKGNVVRWVFESEAEIIHLLQLRELLSWESTLVIPYLPYARQDKDTSNEATFALRAFLPLISGLFKRIEIFDPHNPELVASWVFGAVIIEPRKEIEFAMEQTRANVICYPDEGARWRYAGVAPPLPGIWGQKLRDPATGEITAMSLVDAGTRQITDLNVLIIDDICDGGATFVRLAALLKAAGAKVVHLYVSHGLFTKGLQVLRDAGIQRIFTKEGEQQ